MSTPPPTSVPSTPPPTAWPAPPDPPELPEGVVPTSGRPSWAPVSAVLVILAGLGGAIGASLVIGIIGIIAGANLSDPPPSIAISSTVVQDLCFIGAVVIFASRHGRVGPWQLGLRGTRVWPAVGWMVLAFLALVIFSYAWGALLGINDNEKLPKELGVDRSHVALAFSAVLVTVFAPIAEELMFRAYIFPALRNWKGTWPAVVITGLLFGGLHVLSAPAYAIAPLALFGGLLCLLYLRTKSIYPCIALHSINNAIAFGGAPEVGWSWQIPLLAAGALTTITLVALAVRRRFGAPPAGLSPV
ncbi:CPBP family intramembrane metalloprotease [Paraconexibacter antarcticus]|uniref:CPBP family intramembrane metalloprotease n=1 Tax=Paraconexibacter antarcticus TaxID=2949664 RepID=A0ABY5DTE1_9ACTN|nr:CPBP family intramembrane glutamic endopeptidase [Paraconexibacter antarcticus]UTI64543.1 CPBP family intramembrane metalloprotease [Paraconexibacter antarcticus]